MDKFGKYVEQILEDITPPGQTPLNMQQVTVSRPEVQALPDVIMNMIKTAKSTDINQLRTQFDMLKRSANTDPNIQKLDFDTHIAPLIGTITGKTQPGIVNKPGVVKPISGNNPLIGAKI